MLNAAYKIYSGVINNKLKILTEYLLLEEQSGFIKDKSCSDNIFTLWQIIEKWREFNIPTYLTFIDFQKIFR